MKNPVEAGGGLSVGKTWEFGRGSDVWEVEETLPEVESQLDPRRVTKSCYELRLGGILYPTPVSLLPSSNFE